MIEHRSSWATDDVRLFRTTVRQFIQQEFLPHQSRWRQQHRPDHRSVDRCRLRQAFSSPTCPSRTAVVEEHSRTRRSSSKNWPAPGWTSHRAFRASSRITSSRTGPRSRSSGGSAALACGQPRRRHRDERSRAPAPICRASGRGLAETATTTSSTASKTFITNGCNAGLVCVAVKTDTSAVADERPLAPHRRDLEPAGLSRWPIARKGGACTDRTPASCSSMTCAYRSEHLLGGVEGKGFSQMMEQLPYERSDGRRHRRRDRGAGGGDHDEARQGASRRSASR